MKENDKELRGELTLEKINKTQEINEKLEYIGLNLEEIPETLKQVDIILRALELYAYNLEYMLDGEKSSDDERKKKIAMLKYTYEQVLSDQAEQVNTKRNNTNNLTAYGQKMINDSNIINMIPKNKDIRAV